jgi:hypothetical protein
MERILLAVVVAALALGATCEKDTGRMLANREKDLRVRVEKYHDAFMWRDYKAASELVAPKGRGDFLTYTERLKRGYAVEGFTVKDIKVSPTGEQAAVVVRRSYINPPSITLQSEDLTQEWVYLQASWFLAGPPY